nr:uncharacterized protein LOC113810754 [Penaeus vannamei]
MYIYRGLPGTVATFSFTFRKPHAASTIMNSRVFLGLLLCGLWASSESLVLLGTTAAVGTAAAATAVTASAAAALGVGALAVLKGVLIGKHLKRRRYGRDVDAVQDVAEDDAEDVAVKVAVAQQMDSAGCVAKLLCEIEAMSADQLTPAWPPSRLLSRQREPQERPRRVRSGHQLRLQVRQEGLEGLQHPLREVRPVQGGPLLHAGLHLLLPVLKAFSHTLCEFLSCAQVARS